MRDGTSGIGVTHLWQGAVGSSQRFRIVGKSLARRCDSSREVWLLRIQKSAQAFGIREEMRTVPEVPAGREPGTDIPPSGRQGKRNGARVVGQVVDEAQPRRLSIPRPSPFPASLVLNCESRRLGRVFVHPPHAADAIRGLRGISKELLSIFVLPQGSLRHLSTFAAIRKPFCRTDASRCKRVASMFDVPFMLRMERN